MQTTREPYEFMTRWIPAGAPENQYAGTVQGQINFAFVTRDDAGVVVSWVPDPKGPFHVALTGADGIALDEIVPGLNAAALVDLANTRAALDAAQPALAAAQEEIAALQAQIVALQAQIVALTPPPAPAIPPVSRMQALLALHDAGLLDAVNAIIAQADARTKLAWETATDFHRSSPTIAALWAALGKTDAELDALFIAAKQIAV